MPKIVEGSFSGSGKKFAIVVARWNYFVVEKLLDGALDCLRRHDVDIESDVVVVYCPGCFELPLTVARIAQKGNVNAVIALGAVIRGSTPHFDYVAGEAAKGIGSASMTSGVPCLFGVLTTDSVEQAVERSGTKAGNKGFDAALAALEMANLFESLQ